VTKDPGGVIDVTIRELKDPAGLEARMRADGVPANVSFSGPNPACHPYYPNYQYIPPGYLLNAAGNHPWIHSYDNGSVTVSVTSPADLTLVLRPARMPRGTAFQIIALRGSVVAWGLVKTSPACMGLCRITSEDERAGGDAGARCDQDWAVARYLVDGGAADLPDPSAMPFMPWMQASPSSPVPDAAGRAAVDRAGRAVLLRDIWPVVLD
jgi:hypothetical protein